MRVDRNEYIRAEKLRVISDDGENLGVLDKAAALSLARQKELDLILINPQADPPIAKIISWSKFKYEQSKKKSAQSKTKEVKEMWFKPFIEKADLEHKVKRVAEFLKEGHKVKLTIRAKWGSDQNKLREVVNTILEQLAEDGEAEAPPKFEGRNLSVFVRAKK